MSGTGIGEAWRQTQGKGKKRWSLQGERDTVKMPKGISMGQGTWYTPSSWAKSSYPWTETVEIPKQTQYITLPISTTIRPQCGLTPTQMRNKDFKGYPLGSWVSSTTFLWAVSPFPLQGRVLWLHRLREKAASTTVSMYCSSNSLRETRILSLHPGSQELTIHVHLQQTKQELNLRNALPRIEPRGTGCQCYGIQRSGSLKFAIQHMKKKWVVNRDHLVGNNGYYPGRALKQDPRESNQAIHLETVTSFREQKYFYTEFSHSSGKQNQTASLIHSAANLLWLTGNYTSHTKTPHGCLFWQNNKNYRILITPDWLQ